jgi:hypothetical protein
MPLYDFECPHGHTFESVVSMVDRDKSIPCEGTVQQYTLDELAQALTAEGGLTTPSKTVPCVLKAKRIEIGHSNPGGMLDHGIGANRDAAREGRWNPDRPITKGLRR